VAGGFLLGLAAEPESVEESARILAGFIGAAGLVEHFRKGSGLDQLAEGHPIELPRGRRNTRYGELAPPPRIEETGRAQLDIPRGGGIGLHADQEHGDGRKKPDFTLLLRPFFNTSHSDSC